MYLIFIYFFLLSWWHWICVAFFQIPRNYGNIRCYYKQDNPRLILKPLRVECVHDNPEIYILYGVLNEREINLIKELSKPKVSGFPVSNFQVTAITLGRKSLFSSVLYLSTRLSSVHKLSLWSFVHDLVWITWLFYWFAKWPVDQWSIAFLFHFPCLLLYFIWCLCFSCCLLHFLFIICFQ